MLIADSGSTKTDWCVILDNTPIKGLERKDSIPSSNQKKKFSKN